MTTEIAKAKYTDELSAAIWYINDVLAIEYPTNVISTEYLLLSFLDNKKTHANIILDNLLMSDKIDGLREAYKSIILNSNQGPLVAQKPIPYSTELENLLTKSEEEARDVRCDKAGSEHVLMALLNPQNKFPSQEVFNRVGITYETIMSMLSNSNTARNLPAPPKAVPSKGLVNIKATTSSEEYIKRYTTNLSELARNREFDEIIGRDAEVGQIIKVLARRKKNNVILVGEGGCGKTSVVRCLAQRMVDGTVPSILTHKEIIMLDPMAIMSGTQLRGVLEEHVNGLFKEIAESKKYILFIDDMQIVLKTGSKDKDSDLSDLIARAIGDGKVRIIGALGFKSYRNCIESNPNLTHMFHKLIIKPNTIDESIDILKKNKGYYEQFHNVTYTDNAIKSAVIMADRYTSNRALPDSAFDVIDMAGAKACLRAKDPEEIIRMRTRMSELGRLKITSMNRGDFEEVEAIEKEENAIAKDIADYKRNRQEGIFVITENEIADTVSEITDIPLSNLSSDELKMVLGLSDRLKSIVVGQDEAVEDICKVIKRNRVGLGNKNRPIFSGLFIGNSGVGKSYLAKQLAKLMFGSEKNLIRIDMSEYSERSSVSKLTGASPGYIGYENGGLLTEAVKNHQYCVILLDEIEKAHNEVHNVFLQLLDDGRLMDSSGQLVNFKNAIILMTSNIGVKEASELGDGIGFTVEGNDNRRKTIEKTLKRRFPPEFINRVDKIVYFNQLSDENLLKITRLEIEQLNDRLKENGFSLEYDDDVAKLITDKAKEDKNFGARPIKRLVQDMLEDNITDLILDGAMNGKKFIANVKEAEIQVV